VTAVSKMETVVTSGGLNEKTNSAGSAHYTSSYNLHNLLVAGDKFGKISLVDAAKNKVMDSKALEAYKGRRIISITTCSLEWLEIRLTYVAVVARASPIVSILCWKSNDNRLRHVYSINLETNEAIENVHELEQVENYSYAKLPAEAKISNDFEFLAVTTYDGTVQLLKLPEVLDPLALEANKKLPEAVDAEAKDANIKAQMYASREDIPASTHGLAARADLEVVEHLDLEIADILLTEIPAKKVEKFVDPFVYTEPTAEGDGEAEPAQTPEKSVMAEEPSYTLGKNRCKDS
jgi:hypothetical protein